MGLLLFPALAAAGDFSERASKLAKLETVRVYSDGDSRVRVVLDTAKTVRFKTFVLSNPTRIAVDIEGAWVSPLVPKETPVKGGLVGKVRVSQFDADTVRVVVEANVSKERYKVFALRADAAAKKPHRIVMDFGDLAQEIASAPTSEESLPSVTASEFPTPKPIRFFETPGLKGKSVTIDPGHGGSDPGAIGPKGAMEKNVTFAVASELRAMLEKAGAKVVMTRMKDVDVAYKDASAVDELQARVDVANRANTDLFVSIHMDSFVNQQTGGTSAYIYPKTTGDVRLADFIREGVISQLKTNDRKTRNCNFYVVKHAKMPAVLVEVAFISNAAEEKLLTSAQGVKKAATGIYRGIDRYFSYE